MKYKSLNLLNWQWVIVAISLVLSTVLFLLIRSSAHAATINVVSGTDAINDNNQCQLSEAIQNINDQAQTNNDCPAGDGNNDTINLPAGTVTLSEDSYLESSINDNYQNELGGVRRLVAAEKSMSLVGAGINQTIISGSDSYGLGAVGESVAVKFQDFTINNTYLAMFATLNVQKLELENVFIDGKGDCYTFGVFFNRDGATNGELVANNVTITDFACTQEDVPVLALQVSNSGTGRSTVDIDNLSIYDLSSEASTIGIGISDKTDAAVRNATLTNFFGNDTVSGIAASFNNTTASNSNNTLSYQNVSISSMNSPNSNYSPPGFQVPIEPGAISTVVGSYNTGATSVNVQVQNVVVADSVYGDRRGACSQLNINEAADIPGNAEITITSLGGNISDDASCNDYFTQSTDKNNITNLSSFLGDIANNGGSIPTMALLPGNPAIDGGVCGEGVPETDARGISRPQGKTCDSGAFEVEQAAPTGTVSGTTAVALNVPTGVVVKEFSAVSGSIPADNQGDAEYEFPLGLLSFELGVPQGSANEISLDFESDLDPESVVARKYNPSDQTYTTLENAVVTKITKDNQPTLRLTYTITDGTFPDLDDQANGTIIDPIGLATEKKGVLANTGDLIILAIPIGLSLLLGAFIVTYQDYRKHKKPLQDADHELAKTYTYWHHLKTVTIPLFSYRLSFGFERKQEVPQV